MGPPACLPGWAIGGKGTVGWSPPRPLAGLIPHHEDTQRGAGSPWTYSECRCSAVPATEGLWWRQLVSGAAAPPADSSPLLPANSETVPTNGADYSSICSNPKIKTDKVKIFREQCQAKGIKLLSDLYQSNGFMPFNNFKRNIVFFNTLF